MGKKVTRLYEQFIPEHYGLSLDIDHEVMTFKGSVNIVGRKVGRPSKRLTFHQKELKIKQAKIVKVDKKGEQELVVTRINNQASFDEVRLHTADLIYPGNYTVELEFEGQVTRPMNGIYPCFFKHDGKNKKLIATQFESHHAREAFPCIDEPEAKATFDLTLTTADKQTVIANTPIKYQNQSGKKMETSFETTPKMSTYLLAFVFGDLGYLEAATKDGITVRTYATPDNVKYTQFALECAVKTLEFYNEYFGIDYPLLKCDFVALPDFASGAMENWGCITFREQALLVDPENTSLHLKQYVANVVAHELTHQWFGNLVTMRWWTDLWLNESFASWMSWLAVDHLFPDWKVWTQFIIEEQSLALKLDALENTHPIEVEVKHPDEIRTIFDAISYEKGASVLLMLHDYLGADDFRQGLHLYLERNAYGNTDTVDLWTALEEVSKKPVKQFMGSWTAQAGYPIVLSDENGLKQERFYLNPAAKKQQAEWPIPLLAEGLDLETLDKANIKLKNDSPKLLLNHNRTSFYRTFYSPGQLEILADRVKGKDIDELDRLGLLGDASEAARAGYASTVDALKLIEAYSAEDSTVVWDVIAGSIGGLRVVMDDEDVRSGLKALAKRLSVMQLNRLGWDEKVSDSHFDKLLRPTILGLASYGENETVVHEALKRFSEMSKPEDIHPDLRGVVYGTAARKGGKTEFDKMLKLHNDSTNSEERVTLAGALTGFEQKDLIEKALQKISSDDVRLQDVSYWIAYSFMNRFAKDDTWQWLKDNWDWLNKNIGTDLSFFRMPNYAARNYSDVAFLPEFQTFFENHMSPAFERPVKQAVETIQWQSAWRKRDLKLVKAYLQSI
jgi:aminopeptidase N